MENRHEKPVLENDGIMVVKVEEKNIEFSPPPPFRIDDAKTKQRKLDDIAMQKQLEAVWESPKAINTDKNNEEPPIVSYPVEKIGIIEQLTKKIKKLFN